MTYRNVKGKIFLTKAHRERRVEMARKWITNNRNLKETIFSDEKRFSMDSPDNWISYRSKDDEFFFVKIDYAKVEALWCG